jgi:hypothetical protein
MMDRPDQKLDLLAERRQRVSQSVQIEACYVLSFQAY